MIQNNIDLPGYYIVNEYLFRKRWHAYLAKKRFGKTIVIKRGAEIEDVYLTLPVIEALKEKNPDCMILLMTNFKDAVEGCFDIDGYATFNSPVPCGEFIDLDYAYEKDFRKHIVECYAKVAGVKPKKKTGTLYTQTKDTEYIDNLLKDFPEFIALDFSDFGARQTVVQTELCGARQTSKQDGFKIVTVGKTAAQHPDFLDPDLNLANVLTSADRPRHCKEQDIDWQRRYPCPFRANNSYTAYHSVRRNPAGVCNGHLTADVHSHKDLCRLQGMQAQICCRNPDQLPAQLRLYGSDHCRYGIRGLQGNHGAA
jgi:hypothetical protein